MNRRQFYLIAGIGLAALGPTGPVMAQDMGDNGFVLPGFFFSRAEEIARENCINKLSSCRPSVRQGLELERTISLIAPWFLLALALAGYLAYLHRKDKEKERQRRMAQRKHVPGLVQRDGQAQGR
ncbi:MAG: hypothetical protein EXR11_12480 [Rhodospirillaceae bacterium]|nr:hypothetical protein [Rhodospirillaceae bacterium]